MGHRLCPCDGDSCSLIKLIKLGAGLEYYIVSIEAKVSHLMNKIKIYISILNLSTTAMSARVERHAKVSGPEWFVHSRKVQSHIVEVLNGVVTRLKSKISHLG